jgi:hypothetical protein
MTEELGQCRKPKHTFIRYRRDPVHTQPFSVTRRARRCAPGARSPLKPQKAPLGGTHARSNLTRNALPNPIGLLGTSTRPIPHSPAGRFPPLLLNVS